MTAQRKVLCHKQSKCRWQTRVVIQGETRLQGATYKCRSRTEYGKKMVSRMSDVI